MSKFLTTIPVDVAGVLGALPKRASKLDVRFDPELRVVEVEWDDDDLVTPFTFPLEFSLEDLKAHKLPVGAVFRPDRAAKTPGPRVPTAKHAAVDRHRPARGKTGAR